MRRFVVLLALGLIVTACGASSDGEGTRTTTATGPGSEIAGETLDGERLSLADFRGKPVFVNVWSSW